MHLLVNLYSIRTTYVTEKCDKLVITACVTIPTTKIHGEFIFSLKKVQP